MDNYRSMIEKNHLIVTRVTNPYNNEIEWCIGKLYTDGSITTIAFGATIEEAFDRAHTLVHGDDNE